MDFITDPMAIERRSMEIIAPYLAGLGLSDGETRVFSRIIHAAGDPEYAPIIRVSPGAVDAGIAAIRRGAPVYCDVEMVRTGINKRMLAHWGGEARCLIADPAVAAAAKAEGITRSMAAMRRFGNDLEGAVVAVGNAPTALFELIALMRTGLRPALVVGVPVGFVGARESKDLLAADSPVPFITVLGNKGGSPIAAAAVNAILYMTGADRDA